MKCKIKIIHQKDFPPKLKVIKKVPKLLYVIGNEKLLWEDSFGIVGTRKISDYGIKNCEKIVKEFVFRNIPVISGLAIGTDSVAHKTTLEYNGKTIAVLGSGFGNIFPPENKTLFEEIIENGGLVVTEYDYNVGPCKENFPKRNRIITALSEGVLVVEAGYRSGSSITARNAIEQKKLVFAFPGNLDSKVGVGVNNLIKKGAILTTDIEDILKRYPQFANKLRTEYKKKIIKNENIKKEFQKIYNLIKNGVNEIDDIIEEAKLDTKSVLSTLSNMEIEDLIIQDINGKYAIK